MRSTVKVERAKSYAARATACALASAGTAALAPMMESVTAIGFTALLAFAGLAMTITYVELMFDIVLELTEQVRESKIKHWRDIK